MRTTDWQIEAKQGGIYLPQVDLWMDPKRPQRRALITHAHYDHAAKHQEILASPATAKLLIARLGKSTRCRVLPFKKPFPLGGGASLTLLPAGHILGSAMAWVERSDGKNKTSLLYTGDFKLRKGLSSEACFPKRADVLVMETTFGKPHYLFPPTRQVMEEIVDFCRENLGAGKIPILLGYSLGKSQEIQRKLQEAGLPILVHHAVMRMNQIYRKAGVKLPEAGRLGSMSASQLAGHVLIVPPQMARSKALRELPNRCIAVMTGWALDRGAIYRYGCDRAFPLSDHADYAELHEMVKKVRPKEVRTVHGFTNEFAMDLQAKGLNAWALSGPTQMVLPLDLGP